MKSEKDPATLLEEAVQISVEAHRGQRDRGGQPYILHPLGVMCRMHTTDQKIVAILHDVVEDTDWTLDSLRARGFPEHILQAVDCLTKREGEDYDQFVLRAKGNRLARAVKLGDLADNCDARRSGDLTEKDLERFRKYKRAWRVLTQDD